jgi:hypothetical protein
MEIEPSKVLKIKVKERKQTEDVPAFYQDITLLAYFTLLGDNMGPGTLFH